MSRFVVGLDRPALKCLLPIVALSIASLSGCAAYETFHEAQQRLAAGDTEAGLVKLRQAAAQDPDNLDYRRSYFTQLEIAENGVFRDAEFALNVGAFDTARDAFRKILRLDPENRRARDGVNRADVAERQWKALDSALSLAKEGQLDAAVARTQQVVSENGNNRRAALQLRQLLRQQVDASGKELGIYPKLNAAYRVPVSLTFTNATLLQVFESLKQASGLNYMIERDVKTDLHVTISVTKKPVEDILRLILATNGLERRVLDDDTLLIYPNTPAKATEYREMVVRSFYLNNADATKVASVLKTIGKAKDVVVDEKLNMLIVRDSAEVIRVAEKLIAAQDLAEPEVMLELEVLEVSVSRLLDLGIQWPSTVSAGVIGVDGIAGQLRLNELRNRSAQNVVLSTNSPLITASASSQKSDANLLANPRVRVRNKQSAKVLIGERLPVITTTSTANVGTSDSVSYLDVGLKLEIEPTISLDDDVSMKIALEVSNVIDTTKLVSGTQVYTLGTRNTSTTLRVHDGETNILAGLIQREERRSNTGIPGLNELPIASKLFGAANDSDNRTEIVLLITPHIVRNLDVPGVGLQEFLSGTDGAIGASPIQLGGTPSSVGAPVLQRTQPATPAVLPNVPSRPGPVVPVYGTPTIPPLPPGVVPSQPQLGPNQAPVNPTLPPALVAPTLIPTSPGSS